MFSPGRGSAERQLTNNTTLEVNYIGTHAVHLLDRRNIAQPNDLPAADVAFCQANPTLRRICPAACPAALSELHR